MRKSYIGWWAAAAVILFSAISYAIEVQQMVVFWPLLFWSAVCTFVGYRRWKEYQEWREERESNLRKNEAIIKASEKDLDDKDS